MRIYRDSLSAYSAAKKGSRFCAGKTIRAKRKRKEKPESDQTFEHFGRDSLTLNTNKNIQMKLDQSERYLIPSCMGPRPISLYSLRPGDWIRSTSATGNFVYDLMVVQNSGLLKKVELLWPSGNMDVANYEDIVIVCEDVHYLGHGTKRKWIKHVPAFVRSFWPYFFAPYSKP
jgi:hypothetical protein